MYGFMATRAVETVQTVFRKNQPQEFVLYWCQVKNGGSRL